MTAIAPTQHLSASPDQAASASARGGERECHSQVIESSGDQPWAEFCKGLKQPAFLLAVTGFGDLD